MLTAPRRQQRLPEHRAGHVVGSLLRADSAALLVLGGAL